MNERYTSCIEVSASPHVFFHACYSLFNRTQAYIYTSRSCMLQVTFPMYLGVDPDDAKSSLVFA